MRISEVTTEDYYQYWEDYNADSMPIHKKFIKERGLDARRDRLEVAQFKPEHNSSISGLYSMRMARRAWIGYTPSGDMVGGTDMLGAANAAVSVCGPASILSPT